MFKGNTYITRGINEKLSDEIIRYLWLLVLNETKRKLDYLQIFELRNAGPSDNPVLEVTWRQEQPVHIEKRYLIGQKTSVDKVWIICNAEDTKDEYSTMLLPEEY